MSSGGFASTRYEDDLGNVRRIKVEGDTLLLNIAGSVNAPPSGQITEGIPSAKVTRGAKEIGLKPRYVVCKWTTNPPTNYKPGVNFELPILDPVTFAAINEGDTGTYLGTDITVNKRVSESAN
jgi:hypothetical protein